MRFLKYIILIFLIWWLASWVLIESTKYFYNVQSDKVCEEFKELIRMPKKIHTLVKLLEESFNKEYELAMSNKRLKINGTWRYHLADLLLPRDAFSGNKFGLSFDISNFVYVSEDFIIENVASGEKLGVEVSGNHILFSLSDSRSSVELNEEDPIVLCKPKQ